MVRPYFLISSVSGGSLASADYVCRTADRLPRKERLLHSSRRELLDRMQTHLQVLTETLEGRASEEGIPEDGTENELNNLRLAREMLSDFGKAKYAWILESANVDEMCIDFMAPILRGVYTPQSSRGDSLANFWRERFAWQKIIRSDWNLDTHQFNPARHPLLLLNTCDAGHGVRVAIDFPPLPAGLFAAGRASEKGTAETSREPRSFAELDPMSQCRLSLSRAVRLSSNFPWGFPVSVLGPNSIPPLETSVHFLDGGVVDNTGIDSVAHLFQSLEKVAAAAKGDDRPQRLLDALRQRGVVVIEIDSGAKALESTTAGPLTGLIEPAQALNNALYGNAERTKQSFQRKIEEALQFHLDIEIPSPVNSETERAFLRDSQRQLSPTVLWFPFHCNHVEAKDSEVMTAWALGPDDKAVILSQFLANTVGWDEFQHDVQERFGQVRMNIRQQSRATFLFLIERLVFRVLESMNRTSLQLDEMIQLRSSGKTNEMVALRSAMIRNFQDQQQLIVTAERLANVDFANAPAQLVQNLRSLAGRIQRDMDSLASAKGVDPEMIRNLVSSGTADEPHVTLLVTGLQANLRVEASNLSKESQQGQESMLNLQKKITDRSSQNQDVYNKLRGSWAMKK